MESILQRKIYLACLNQTIEVEVDLEAENPDLKDFDPLIIELERLEHYLTKDKYDDLIERVSKEITESAYEQDDFMPTADDIEVLKKDFILEKVSAFSKCFLMEYSSKKTFPDSFITVQLTKDFEIDDVAVNQ